MKKIEKKIKKMRVKYLKIKEEGEERRIDNYLISILKNVPKSHIYRIIRHGEVRVNKKRISVSHRLKRNDIIRLPPIFQDHSPKLIPPSREAIDLLTKRVLFEDENILVINKPSGLPVHAGSTVPFGVIEILRHLYPKSPQLELAHRLDSETSGCLILAKKKKVLRELHTLLREGKMIKIYWALTKGIWKKEELRVDLALHKDYREGKKHVVSINAKGKSALTEFKLIQSYKNASLVEAKLFTGRTHQIRVHAKHQGHPIAADDRYGETEFNKFTRTLGLRCLFLHAKSVEFTLPSLKQHIKVEAPLDLDLKDTLRRITSEVNKSGI